MKDYKYKNDLYNIKNDYQNKYNKYKEYKEEKIINNINNYEKNIYIKEKKYYSFDDLINAVRRLQRIPTDDRSLEIETQIQSESVEMDLYEKINQKIQSALNSIDNVTGGNTTYLSYSIDKTTLAQQIGNVLNGTPGIFYKFDRGVVLVDSNGNRKEEILDGTYNHHVDATVRQSASFGITVTNEAPYNAGVDAATQGLVVMQFEGDNGIIYLPNNLTLEQIDVLIDEIVLRTMFNFNIYQSQQIFDDDYNTLSFLKLLDQLLKKINVDNLSTKK